ncbi:MAG: hypothetical protein JXB17_04060, partial [Bacteroidales bacterium]|nr:hypothetical protein [Bacteroidales bacterium]
KIYGLNTSFFIKNDVKTLFLQKLVNSNLNKIIFHFDDWVVGLDVIKNNGGIIFGVPIGDGKIFQMNKKVMLDYGIKNIIKDWSCWRDIISIIKSRNIV